MLLILLFYFVRFSRLFLSPRVLCKVCIGSRQFFRYLRNGPQVFYFAVKVACQHIHSMKS